MTQINDQDSKDQVILETRRIKQELARSMDFDVDRIVDASRAKQDEGGKTVLPPPARQVT